MKEAWEKSEQTYLRSGAETRTVTGRQPGEKALWAQGRAGAKALGWEE